MDPLTQGTLGAVAAQSFASIDKQKLGVVCLLGFLSGMAADLDVLFQSDTDPLLFLEYHRQFTHSLIFIPIGGFLCAVLWHFLAPKRWALPWKQTWAFATLGYATHALLDACTSYGTQLFWPFSSERVSWNTVSIIDPLFTIPLLVLMVLAVVKQKPYFARIAMVWALVYLSLGLVQRNRAEDAGQALALSRGHVVEVVNAKPSFANLLVWKTIYEHQGRFYVDAVRTGIKTKVYEGESIAKLNLARDFPWLDKDSQQAKDVERFRWFSQGFVAKHPDYLNQIMDVRYSSVPNEINPLWMIGLNPEKDKYSHVGYYHPHRGPQKDITQDLQTTANSLGQMLLGKDTP